MRKILSGLVLLSALILMVMPMIVLAQEPPEGVTECTMRHSLTGADWEDAGFICASEGAACPFDSTTYTCGICCLMDTIYTVTDWVFIAVIVIATIFIFMGAFNIVTAGGSPEKIETGRKYIISAVGGLIVALLAKSIPAIARSILGM